MKTNIKMLAAVSIAISMGWSAQASATVYAGSSLNVEGLTIVPSDQSGFPFSGTAVNDWDFSVAGTARLDGASTGGNIACGGDGVGLGNCSATGARLGPFPVNAPGSNPTRSGSDYSFFNPGSPTAVGDYGNSNGEITTAGVIGDGVTATNQISESELNTGSDAGATSDITSNTGFTFSFTISGGGAPGSLALDFFADPDLYSFVTADEAGATTSAFVDASITLTQDTGGSGFVTWAPDGIYVANTAGNCIAVNGPTCTETNDSEDLQANVGTNTPGTDDWFSDARGTGGVDLGLTAFGIDIQGLSDGNWTLVLAAGTRTNITRRQVPEPGVLLLLAAGFIGLGAVRGRGRKRAA